MTLFGSNQRKTLTEIKTHLIPENGFGANAGAVMPFSAMLHDVPEKIQILLHIIQHL